ncbi:glutamate-rich protein 2 isoform X6 [Conger conger]|uniref:glutamate-rich protein 2 isoform X6 n=1 Tax=Conger conger TaxID=82655 RepID=UPI002A5A4DB0|nr:glutamate-rich protein 2 isoform X6 [Conger conger]
MLMVLLNSIHCHWIELSLPSEYEQKVSWSTKKISPTRPVVIMQFNVQFLKSVLDKDYILAKKLCEMILIYEPDNPEAKQFIPLIEEKLHLVGQEECEDDESSNDSEDSSDSSDSGEESSESS